jgi:hypothetical protein
MEDWDGKWEEVVDVDEGVREGVMRGMEVEEG